MTAKAVVLVIGVVVGTLARADAPAAKPSLLGRWHVVGCATSPGDPADCARGRIAFEAARWSIDLPCCKVAHAYTVVSAAPHVIKISSEGAVSEIRIDSAGTAHWTPGLGGRVGELSFVRDATAP